MKNIPLYQSIYNHYFNKIKYGELNHGDKIPTEKELSEEFHVSRITAKKAINMLADENLVERIPGRGTYVKTEFDYTKFAVNENKLIGVILCDFDYTFGMGLLKSIEDEISNYGYKMVFKRTSESRELEVQAIRDFIDLGVSGIMIQTVHGDYYSDEVLRLYLSGMPIVFVDRYMEKTEIPYVASNNRKASFELTSKLLDAGYKNLSFISANPKGTTTLQQRYDGYKEAARNSNQLDILNLETPLTRLKTDEKIQKDVNIIYKHLMDNSEIDCIFAGEMYIAKLVRSVIRSMGKSIPEDIGIVTFDNDTSASKYAYYTHVLQDEVKMGMKAVEMLHKIITNQFDKEEKRVLVDCEIYSCKTTIEI